MPYKGQFSVLLGKLANGRGHYICNVYFHWPRLCLVCIYKENGPRLFPPSSCDVDGSMQERCNSSVSAMELRLSCFNPSIWWFISHYDLCMHANLAFTTIDACKFLWSMLWTINIGLGHLCLCCIDNCSLQNGCYTPCNKVVGDILGWASSSLHLSIKRQLLFLCDKCCGSNYTNPGYGFSLVDTLWNAGSYRQPLEQEGNPMT